MNNKTENAGFNSIGNRLDKIPDLLTTENDSSNLEANSVTTNRPIINAAAQTETHIPNKPTPKNSFNPIKYIIFGIFSILSKIPVIWWVIGGFIGFAFLYDQYHNWVRSKTTSAFASEIANYQTYYSTSYSKPHLTSRMVVIDSNTNAIDQVYYDLPDNIKAGNPNDVGAVALVSCSENLVGKYTSGSLGYKTDCSVSVIDRSTLIKYESTIQGQNPPQSKKGNGDWRQRPNSDISYYLKSLY